MTRIWLAVAASISLLTPLVSQAKGVSIPQLGIDLADAPEKTSEPLVYPQPGGVEGIVRVGDALLVAYRSGDLVPTGASVTDEAFRDRLGTMPALISPPQSKGRLTLLAGQPAWAFFDGYLGSQWSEYVLVVYAIIDRHLYILEVDARTPSRKSSPDFDEAVRALQSTHFVPVDGALQATHSKPQTGTPPLPPMKRMSNDGDFYPPPAQRLGIEGEVDLTLRIDGHGHPREVQQTYAAGPYLGSAAEDLVGTLRFDVPHDWHASGSDRQRFPIEVQFTMSCQSGWPFDYPPRVAGALVVSVCASRRRNLPAKVGGARG